MLSKKSFLLNKLWVGLLALTSAHTMVNGDPANTISFAGVEFRIIKSGESDHRFIWLHGISVGGPLWSQDGAYTVTAQQGNDSMFTDSVEVEVADGLVVPEFGTIAAMILAVAIISIIAISAKSRLSIVPRY